MRHGRIAPQVPWRFVGQRDLPLDETGRRQAQLVRERLREIEIGRIVSSDLGRAMETARIVAAGKDLTIEAEPALREIHLGEWEGLSVNEVQAAFPGEYERRGRDLEGVRPAGGESFRDLLDRVLPVFEALAAGPAPSTLIVAHAGVNRVILCHLLGMPLSNLLGLGQDYGCLNVIGATSGRRRLDLLNLPPGAPL
jgi:probable phosphoglycerate mutase